MNESGRAQTPFSLEGKVVLITGCGSIGEGWGNGKAIAVLCAQQGAMVYGVDINLNAALSTQHEIHALKGTSFVERRDVTDASDVSEMVDACIDRFGCIDILINNVGRSEPGDPVTMEEEIWEEQIQINLNSAFYTMKKVIPHMAKRGGGSIVNISSVAGVRYIGKPQVGYSAAKAALMRMTSTTAVIHAKDNVRINCIVPGLMNTPLVHRLAEKYANGDYQGFVQARHEHVPMGRMGDAWDVAYAALFLASNESRYITGIDLVVDGGLTCVS